MQRSKEQIRDQESLKQISGEKIIWSQKRTQEQMHKFFFDD